LQTMPTFSSWVMAAVLTGIIGVFTVREIGLYRADQRERSEIYPYTRKRLVRRLIISACLVGEVLFLFVLRQSLSTERPLWFVVYVTFVLVFAGLMVLLALLDLRESHELHAESHRRLFQEFLHEIQQDSGPPEVH
jgi:hypothetical protein